MADDGLVVEMFRQVDGKLTSMDEKLDAVGLSLDRHITDPIAHDRLKVRNGHVKYLDRKYKLAFLAPLLAVATWLIGLFVGG